jgi:mRNA-degrading endonuclease YafQ of YafQ-DinJ toxin-antitoxin module
MDFKKDIRNLIKSDIFKKLPDDLNHVLKHVADPKTEPMATKKETHKLQTG